MTLPLTVRQERLWRFIKSCDRSPSYQEMAEALGDPAKGAGVVRTLEALEHKGFIRRRRRRNGRHTTRCVVAVDPNLSLADFTTEELAAELARRLTYSRSVLTGDEQKHETQNRR